MDFIEFPKIARLSREVIITEKIDGTNAQIFIDDNLNIQGGSRSRWITPQDDNFGFATWVAANIDEIRTLGPGRHFGEWWGSGIQRGYGLSKGEKRFSLFNTSRWALDRPSCCDIVPTLYQDQFHTSAVEDALDDLRQNGSRAAQGFMKPEGVVVYHIAGNIGFKKTIEKDNEPKSLQK